MGVFSFFPVKTDSPILEARSSRSCLGREIDFQLRMIWFFRNVCEMSRLLLTELTTKNRWLGFVYEVFDLGGF